MNKKNTKLFISFIISYFLFFAICGSIALVMYYQSINIIREQITVNFKNNIEKCIKEIDSAYQEIDFFCKFIEESDELASVSLLEENYEDKNYYDIYTLHKLLISYSKINSIFTNSKIIFDSTNIVLSNKKAIKQPAEFYESEINYKELTYKEWLKELTKTENKSGVWPSKYINNEVVSGNYITYVYSFPSSVKTITKGYIITLLDEKFILNKISENDENKEMFFFVFDEQGELIVKSHHNRFSFENYYEFNFMNENSHEFASENTIIETKSEVNSWTYLAIIPNKTFYQKAERLEQTFVYICCIGFFVGIIIIFAFSYKNSKPINEIIKKIHALGKEEDKVYKNNYVEIEENIDRLIEETTTLSEENKRIIPLLNNVFFEKLYKGGFANNKNIEFYAKSIQLDMIAQYYIVVLFKIEQSINNISLEGINQLNNDKTLIYNLMKSKMKNTIHVHSFFEDEFIVLVTSNNEINHKALYNDIYNVISESKSNYNIRLLSGIGLATNELINIKGSYKQARIAMENCGINHGDYLVQIYTKKMENTAMYKYSIDDEILLMNTISSGVEQEVTVHLENIFNENFINAKIISEMQRLLISEMEATIQKLKYRLTKEGYELSECDKMINIMHEKQYIYAQYNEITRICVYMCRAVFNKRMSQKDNLKNKIIMFLNANYKNHNLSLTTLSQEFSLSEKYVSLYFKNNINENFSCYIENLRLKEAANLLRNNEKICIDTIANQVGYNSANTFYRAFKRKFGMSPSKYRKINGKQL